MFGDDTIVPRASRVSHTYTFTSGVNMSDELDLAMEHYLNNAFVHLIHARGYLQLYALHKPDGEAVYSEIITLLDLVGALTPTREADVENDRRSPPQSPDPMPYYVPAPGDGSITPSHSPKSPDYSPPSQLDYPTSPSQWPSSPPYHPTPTTPTPATP